MNVIVPYEITDANLTSSSIAEDDHAAWDSATTYPIGARVIRTETHRIYESIKASNVGLVPESNPLAWFEVGPTNKWAMFDGSASTATEHANTITVVLQIDGPVNDIVFVEATGYSVDITLPDYSTTVSFPEPVPPATTSTVYLSDIGSAGGQLTLQITGPYGVSVGALAVGNKTFLGQTQRGSGIGIVDYSRRAVDEFGAVSFTRRGYSKRINARIVLATSDVDRVSGILTALRSVPAVWIGSSQYLAMIAFGYFRDWSIAVSNYVTSELSLEIESLVLDASEQTAPEVIEVPVDDTISVSLTNPNLASVATLSDTSAEAGITLQNDGLLYWYTKINGSFTGQGYRSGEWSANGAISTAIASDYEVQFGADAWQPLSANRSLSSYATSGQDLTVSTTAKIRRIGQTVTLGSSPITLRAAVPAPAPPPPPAPPDPVTDLALDPSYSHSVSDAISAELVLYMESDGTWSVRTVQDLASPIEAATGDWHPSPASGVGVDFQAKVTASGSLSIVNQMSSWTSLAGNKTCRTILSIPTNNSASGSASLAIQVRRIGGTAEGTDSVTFNVSGTGISGA